MSAVEESYAPSSLKPRRFRRTKADIKTIHQAIGRVLKEEHPMTVRQLFYALVVLDVVQKTEKDYSQTVIRQLTKLRRAGIIPYEWIEDNTRWVRQPDTYLGLADAVMSLQEDYRRALWEESPVHLEMWCEKDALGSVIAKVTIPYDVALMVSRGFSSETFLQSCAETIVKIGKPAHVFHFGDHDPSGVWIARKTEEWLRKHAGQDAPITFERVAVTREQISKWNLPTRPTKRIGNRHAKNFEGDSVELDAIPPRQLRALVKECIERHVDQEQVKAIRAIEEKERKFLAAWADVLQLESPESDEGEADD